MQIVGIHHHHKKLIKGVAHRQQHHKCQVQVLLLTFEDSRASTYTSLASLQYQQTAAWFRFSFTFSTFSFIHAKFDFKDEKDIFYFYCCRRYCCNGLVLTFMFLCLRKSKCIIFCWYRSLSCHGIWMTRIKSVENLMHYNCVRHYWMKFVQF